MRVLLFVLSLCALAFAVVLSVQVESAVHQTVSALWYLVAAVLFGCGAIVDAIVDARGALTSRLKKPETAAKTETPETKQCPSCEATTRFDSVKCGACGYMFG